MLAKFTSKERDQESGLDFLGARYMSSAQGRFNSADRSLADQHTTSPQRWNLYAYARNNPLKLVDMNGFKVIEAVVAEAVQKMSTNGGGRFYLDFAGIQGLHGHQSLGPHSNSISGTWITLPRRLKSSRTPEFWQGSCGRFWASQIRTKSTQQERSCSKRQQVRRSHSTHIVTALMRRGKLPKAWLPEPLIHR